MSSFNKVILMGNITRDPDLRVTPKGVSVCQFSLAVNSSYRDKDGNVKEEVSFIDVDSFGKQADVIAKHLSKGRPVLVEGRLKQDTWEDKDGGRRSKIKVVLEGFQFIGSPQRPETPSETRSLPAFPARQSTRPARTVKSRATDPVGAAAAAV